MRDISETIYETEVTVENRDQLSRQMSELYTESFYENPWFEVWPLGEIEGVINALAMQEDGLVMAISNDHDGLIGGLLGQPLCDRPELLKCFGELYQDDLYIRDIFISSAYRGRGYGKYLLNRAEAYTLGSGIGRLTLKTLQSARHLHDIYCKAGFRPVGAAKLPLQQHFTGASIYQKREFTLFAKDLDPSALIAFGG